MPWIEGALLQQLAIIRRCYAPIIVHYDGSSLWIPHYLGATRQTPPLRRRYILLFCRVAQILALTQTPAPPSAPP